MRGMAALAVAVFHALVFYTLTGPGWPGGIVETVMTTGWMGVDFFFVLSGFLLGLPLLARIPAIRSGSFWRTYLTKRFFRIAPPYYAAVLLALAVGIFVWNISFEGSVILAHLLYIQNLDPASLRGINLVFWTLAIEFQFYLVLPFMALLFVRGRKWPWAVAAFVVITLIYRGLTNVPSSDSETFWRHAQLPAYLAHFAFGLAAARLHMDGWKLPIRPAAVATIVAGGLVALFLLLPLPRGDTPGVSPIFANHEWISDMVFRMLVGLLCAVFLLSVIQQQSAFSRLFSSRPMQWLGESSYSLYLVHAPLGLALIPVWPLSVAHGFWAFLAIYLAVVFAATAVAYVLIERPSVLLKDRLAARTTTRRPVPMRIPRRAPESVAVQQRMAVEAE